MTWLKLIDVAQDSTMLDWKDKSKIYVRLCRVLYTYSTYMSMYVYVRPSLER